jgi:hypothetical protein
VHNHLRTHGSEGATELDRDGPGSFGPSRPAWPTSVVGSAPLSLHPTDLQPLSPGGGTIHEERAIHISNEAPTSGEERRHHLELEISGGGRSPKEDRTSRRKHPQVEKKEDTIGSITMDNGAMSSTFMG